MSQYARGECSIHYGLATRRREKGVADKVDIKLLQMQLWSDQDPIPSTRMVFSASYAAYMLTLLT